MLSSLVLSTGKGIMQDCIRKTYPLRLNRCFQVANIIQKNRKLKDITALLLRTLEAPVNRLTVRRPVDSCVRLGAAGQLLQRFPVRGTFRGMTQLLLASHLVLTSCTRNHVKN